MRKRGEEKINHVYSWLFLGVIVLIFFLVAVKQEY